MLWFQTFKTEDILKDKYDDISAEDLLIKQASNGDSSAFGELVSKYENMVYNTAIQSLRNPEDAADISQDVFIKVWRSLGSFRGDSKFSTWLFRITTNQIKDFVRSRSRHSTISLSEYSGEEDVEKQTDIPDTSIESLPEDAYLRDEVKDAVREVIFSMSEDHRKIILLRDIEGYTYEEIAEMLDLEIGTVKSRINRARLAIKELLIKRNIL